MNQWIQDAEQELKEAQDRVNYWANELETARDRLEKAKKIRTEAQNSLAEALKTASMD